MKLFMVPLDEFSISEARASIEQIVVWCWVEYSHVRVIHLDLVFHREPQIARAKGNVLLVDEPVVMLEIESVGTLVREHVRAAFYQVLFMDLEVEGLDGALLFIEYQLIA